VEAYGYRRVSGDRQKGNSSFARQAEDEITPFIEEEGWTLAGWINDDGVSASTGANITSGSLSDFIRECEIEGGEGKVFVVGEQDRLSRIHPVDFFGWFYKVLQTGLTIGFADNRMVVDLRSFRNQERQMRRIMDDAAEANRYTERLGRRVRAAWQQMRDDGRPVHCRSTCPAWLELTPDRSRFRDDTATALYRIALINEMFDLRIGGMGFAEMERHLNERGEPTWRGGKGWRKSTLKHIINGRQVLGEYQHHVRRKPIGDPVADYFPQVVSNEKWQAANHPSHQQIMASRSRQKLTNLLTDVARCGECGSRMLFRNKARRSNGEPVAYLQCDRAARRFGCSSRKMIRYYPLERQVLDALLVRALDDQHFQRNDEVSAIRRKMADQKRVIEDIHVRLANCVDSIERFADKPSLMAKFEIRLRTVDADLDTANKVMTVLSDQLSRARGKASRAEHVSRVTEIRENLRSLDQSEADAASLLVKAALNEFVEVLHVSAQGCLPALDGLAGVLQMYAHRPHATAVLTGGIGTAFFSDGGSQFFELLKRGNDRTHLTERERGVVDGYLRRVG
jgi:DNA invertase Pin-like site-specific DNA recombinase